VQGVILAGGKSSRMGTPKELLPIAEEPLIQRTWKLMNKTVENSLIISNHPERLDMIPEEVPIYPDDVAEQGPLGGIATAMRVTTQDVLLVVACDMPAISEQLLQLLCNKSTALKQGTDIILPLWKGKAHPLCALYHRRLYPLILELLAQGKRRMFDVIDQANVLEWDATPYFTYDPFYNLNTILDYEQFRKGERT
jgi:molybdopterin-guanine dinucleotide biosynthesis protein A